jgi:transaldolase
MSTDQIKYVLKYLENDTPTILSVFAGRIADTGRDPLPIINKSVKLVAKYKAVELLWASTRELLNIVQANDLGCDIITVSEDLLDKMHLIGKNLDDFSRETVEMFYKDAVLSNFKV